MTTFTGSAKVWTTSRWQNIEHIYQLLKEGKNDEAISDMSYINHDMSDATDWAEVGVAQITVTLYPREELVAKELDGLKAQLQKVRAENEMRENAILDRISKLLALEHEGASA